MQHLNEKYPETTEVFQFGQTEGGVDIMGIRVTSEEHLAQETLPIIFVTAATSARDWITAMSAVNLIHMLVEYRSFYGDIVDNIDWYILPVANPDGYNFSMTEGVKYS
jgi:murein tripeptide amidase MpaA